MDIVLGITTKDAVIIATSKAAVRGISILKVTDDKTRQLSDNSLMAFTGEAGDTVQFAELIQANARLYSMRNGVDLSPTAISNFTRNELANALRSRKPFQVNVLIAGFDKKTNKSSLNWIDYLAANVSLPYAAHGYASYYTLSLLDRHHKKDMNLEEGLELLKACIAELQKRIPFDFKGVYVKIVDKDGVRDLDDIE
ncbi:proteasome component C11 [Nadsonia fulvescens var. elongata DSM 6958]|uniref:Proteasome subunit beta n=1 Tax=Nadsonia fulvescens var. elongata DSM 6958 TaxID=857566 RepID=A0A1E3PJZ5_9ASCO|nr:proteasome component C11 [Nadsonia fulvescens var. elongata DSM 6958]